MKSTRELALESDRNRLEHFLEKAGGAELQIKHKLPQMTDLEMLSRFYEETGYYLPDIWTFSPEIQP
ncbi:MAG: hypothetical protein ANABAC_1867 [Anaerolineae bacterium]|nr:MAG: hypothetical protein ANABAC_1867 [Anaerolineae bacterium]